MKIIFFWLVEKHYKKHMIFIHNNGNLPLKLVRATNPHSKAVKLFSLKFPQRERERESEKKIEREREREEERERKKNERVKVRESLFSHCTPSPAQLNFFLYEIRHSWKIGLCLKSCKHNIKKMDFPYVSGQRLEKP